MIFSFELRTLSGLTNLERRMTKEILAIGCEYLKGGRVEMIVYCFVLVFLKCIFDLITIFMRLNLN